MGVLGDSGLIVPPSDNPDDVRGYLREAVQEADNFLRQQHGYLQIDLAQRLIAGLSPDDIRSSDLSQVVDNEFGSIWLQLAAQNTDTRPFFFYATKNPDYQQQAVMLNGCAEHWWLGRQIDMRFRDAINGCSTGGTSCLWTRWNPDLGDFESLYIDGRDARPTRPSSFHSYQDCEVLTIVQERSVNELKRRWPSMSDQIRADRDGAAALSDEAETYSQKVLASMNKSPFSLYREFLSKAKAAMSAAQFPVADLHVSYLHDYSRNHSKDAKLMGPWSRDGKTPLRNWSYRVEPGQLLYPGGRVVVWTNSCVFYDGPNSYWHDQFPASKLTLIQPPYPKFYLGKAALWDLIGWQRELNESQRVISDHMKKFVEPDLVIDQNSGLSRAAAEKIRTRKAGGKFFKRPGPGDGFRFEYPEPLPAEVLMRPETIIGRMRSLAQTFDMQTVLNKGQLPANETLNAILNVQTAGIRMQSRTLEAFIREVGGQMAYNFVQHYTKAMRLTIGGPRFVTPQDWDGSVDLVEGEMAARKPSSKKRPKPYVDVDPNVLVPQFVGEDFDSRGQVKPERMMQPRTRRSRAKDYLRYFSLDIKPDSMLKAAHVDEEMKFFQLARGGFIDPVTLLEQLDFPNIGQNDIPNGDPGTVMGRLIKMSELNLMGQVSAAGRKSSGQNPPQVKGSGAVSETT